MHTLTHILIFKIVEIRVHSIIKKSLDDIWFWHILKKGLGKHLQGVITDKGVGGLSAHWKIVVDYELKIQNLDSSKSTKGGKKLLWLYVRLLLDLIKDTHSFLGYPLFSKWIKYISYLKRLTKIPEVSVYIRKNSNNHFYFSWFRKLLSLLMH